MGKKLESKVEALMPKPFDLRAHLSIPVEAERFQLPEETVEKVAEEEGRGGSVLVSLRIRESELRDKLKLIMDEEIRARALCAWDGCKAQLHSFEQAAAHIRWHLINQSFDPRTSRQAILDVEQRLFPVIEKEVSAILPAEEREKLRSLIEERRAQLKPLSDELGDS